MLTEIKKVDADSILDFRIEHSFPLEFTEHKLHTKL